MAVGKTPPRGGWGKCSNRAPFDLKLTAAACRVYMAIACHGGSSGKSTASRETLAGNLGMSVSTIKRAVRVLIERGYVVEATKAGPNRSRTLEVIIPPLEPPDDADAQDGQAAEASSKGSPVRPKKGSPVRLKGGHQSTSKGVTSAPQRITSERRTVEEEPEEEEPDGSSGLSDRESGLLAAPPLVLTLSDQVASDRHTLIELKTRLANVPTTKDGAKWVHGTARILAEEFADGHSSERYMKLLWQVVKKKRPAEDILRAFKETNQAMMDGKVRETAGQFFFGCLTTGYDGDRAMAEELEDRRNLGRK